MNRKYIRFYFTPEGGGGFGGGDATQQQQNGTQNNQQQQQQEPVVAFNDPFKGMDIDSFDDATKAAIQSARTEGTRLAQEAATARAHQSRADRATVDLQRLQTEIKIKAAATQPPPQTLEDEIAQEFIAGGLSPEQAKQAAAIQAKTFSKFAQRQNAHINQQLQPVMANVAEQQAQFMFQNTLQNNQLMQANPDVAQAVWSQVAEATQAGHQLNEGQIAQLAKIAYVDFIEKNPAARLPLQNQPQPPVNNQQQTSRYTFPGAGHIVARPQIFEPQRVQMNPETASAIAAVTNNWKAWSPTGVPTKPNVTRGGM